MGPQKTDKYNAIYKCILSKDSLFMYLIAT